MLNQTFTIDEMPLHAAIAVIHMHKLLEDYRRDPSAGRAYVEFIIGNRDICEEYVWTLNPERNAVLRSYL